MLSVMNSLLPKILLWQGICMKITDNDRKYYSLYINVSELSMDVLLSDNTYIYIYIYMKIDTIDTCSLK